MNSSLNLRCRNAPTATQDNALIRSAYTLTTLQKRLVLVGISKVNPEDAVIRGKAPEKEIEVSAKDWAQVYPQDPNPYRSLKRAARSLLSRQWRVYHEDGRLTEYNWLSRCTYDTNRGIVEMVFTNDTALRLYGLSKQFTKYQLHQVGMLGSFNQIRLYEFLSQYRSTGFLRITLNQMRESLQLEGKHPRWADLKRQVIEPSLKAVNAQTDLDVKYKPFKKARSIVGLEFVFSVKPRVIQQQVPLDL